MKRLNLHFGQTFEPFRQCTYPARLPSHEELAAGGCGGNLNRSAVTFRTDALDQFPLYQAFDNPAHGRWADLFQSREFANALGAEKYQDREGGELRRPDARLGILCPDEPEQPDSSRMQSISHGDFQCDFA
jgi:hypothetical protein